MAHSDSFCHELCSLRSASARQLIAEKFIFRTIVLFHSRLEKELL